MPKKSMPNSLYHTLTFSQFQHLGQVDFLVKIGINMLFFLLRADIGA